MGGDSRLSRNLFVCLLFLQFLEGLVGEDFEEFFLLVFEKLQHAFLFELFAVDVLHKEFIAGEVAARNHLFDIFGQVYVVPKNVVRPDKSVGKNVDVQLHGIALCRVHHLDFGLALFGTENINVVDGFADVLRKRNRCGAED